MRKEITIEQVFNDDKKEGLKEFIDNHKQETLEEVKDLAYYRANAEEDYLQVPISVLRYISELEERSYSEEEVKFIISEALESVLVTKNLDLWFNIFKKKQYYGESNYR